MSPKQRQEAAIYIAWLRSDRDLSPDIPIRAAMATFLEQLLRPERRGRPPVETVLQRYRRRQERVPWIRKVRDAQRKLKRQGERKHLQMALAAVARETGAPTAETLRNWVRRDRGNSRFLPWFDDGTLNAAVEPIRGMVSEKTRE